MREEVFDKLVEAGEVVKREPPLHPDMWSRWEESYDTAFKIGSDIFTIEEVHPQTSLHIPEFPEAQIYSVDVYNTRFPYRFYFIVIGNKIYLPKDGLEVVKEEEGCPFCKEDTITLWHWTKYRCYKCGRIFQRRPKYQKTYKFVNGKLIPKKE